MDEFVYSPAEAVNIALRNMSGLACVYTDQASSMIQQICDEKADSALEWFKQVFLPLSLLKRSKGFDKEGVPDQDSTDMSVWYELDHSLAAEKLDKNICLFLNELTGHGHLYAKEAQAQRQEIRKQLLVSCLDSLKGHVERETPLKEMTVLEEARLVSCLLII